jgi:NTP pyrophosphatase (non-canonical NTP hydrolase)
MYNDEDMDIIQQGFDDFPEVEGQIVTWAENRNLIDGSTSKDQMVKLMEEMGELASGICRNDEELIKDSIGDVFVVLTIIAAQCGVDVEGCALLSYNEIKDRKGEMRDGIFVKEQDL